MTNEIATMSVGSFQATETGLVVRAGATFEEWQAYGKSIKRVEGAIQWVIGDWLNYGELSYGERFAQAMEMWPETAYDTLTTYKWVSARVSPPMRIGELSWYHHRTVSKLESRDQERWLAKAVKEGWSFRELAEAISEPKRLGSPREDTLFDKLTDAVQEASRILHIMGSPRTPAERKQNIAYVKQAISALRTALAGAEKLLEQMQNGVAK